MTALRAFGVVETPERPGPGPMPEPLLRALELSIGRRVDGLLAGDHRSHLLGRGSELAQVRPYVPGDDVRLIDWNVTARTREPHIRVQLAERVLVTWVVLDRTPSMGFGTADRRKADVALGVALALGHAASMRGNRVGLVSFGSGPDGAAAAAAGPRRARRAAARARRRGRRARASRRSSHPRSTLLAAVARQRSLVAVVSDFRGPRDWRPQLVDLAAPPRRARGRDPRPARGAARRRGRGVVHRPRDGRAAPRRHRRRAPARAVRRGGRAGASRRRRRSRRRTAPRTSSSRRAATGCASSRRTSGGAGELRHSARAARPARRSPRSSCCSWSASAVAGRRARGSGRRPSSPPPRPAPRRIRRLLPLRARPRRADGADRRRRPAAGDALRAGPRGDRHPRARHVPLDGGDRRAALAARGRARRRPRLPRRRAQGLLGRHRLVLDARVRSCCLRRPTATRPAVRSTRSGSARGRRSATRSTAPSPPRGRAWPRSSPSPKDAPPRRWCCSRTASRPPGNRTAARGGGGGEAGSGCPSTPSRSARAMRSSRCRSRTASRSRSRSCPTRRRCARSPASPAAGTRPRRRPSG